MNIIKLEIENVKRIKTACIEPDGPVIVIGGKNGAGKSSAIDSIAWVLGGKALCQDEPLRRGAKRGFVKVDLGEYTAERIFTPGGSRLVVKGVDGGRYGQALLEKMIDKAGLGFDPMAFLDMSRAEQLEVIKRLVGVNCDDLKETRDKAYDQRTEANRAVKALKARVDTAPHHKDAPRMEVPASDLFEEFDRRHKANSENDAERNVMRLLKEEGIMFRKDVEDLQRQLEKKKALLVEATEKYKAQEKIVDLLEDANVEEIRQEIDICEETNRKVRENLARAKLAKELKEAKTRADGLTEQIEACDEEKIARLAAAEFPVEGLAFSDDSVTFNDLPLDQASQAEQIHVVVGIALALSGEFKIALVRRGSLLDDDNLAQLYHEVKTAGGQLWLEHARAGSEATVVFEDGEIAGADDA